MKNFMFAILALVMLSSIVVAASSTVSVGESTNLVDEPVSETGSDAAVLSADKSTRASSSTGFSRCVVDADCDAGDVCILGDCYTPLECRADSECGDKEVCYRGICISPICIVSAECPTDFICTSEGTCEPKECVGDSFCGPGKKCVNYECVDAPEPMVLEEEPEEPEPEPVSLAAENNCPVCKCDCNCQRCEKCPSCPELECPACGPFDGELEIPILLFGLVVVAAIGFFAGKMGGDSSGEDVKLDRVKSSNEGSGRGEPDINDEASFRYI
ncbi:hypothetical protein GF412_05845 [Candidatus Micrarchaeota archaeon]|nr:hypothetical protein [Candidatus Micrarchaeota archaeon]MBD3418470.1 hypothetical protein [Candidatus Micrarchaeota archaeon]